MRTFAIEAVSQAIEIIAAPVALVSVVIVLAVILSGVAGRAVLFLESRFGVMGESVTR